MPHRVLSGPLGQGTQRGRVGPEAVLQAPVEGLLARRVRLLAAECGIPPRPALGQVLLGGAGLLLGACGGGLLLADDDDRADEVFDERSPRSPARCAAHGANGDDDRREQ